MTRSVEAIFQNGVLVPLKTIDWLQEDQRVSLAITTLPPPFPFRDLSWLTPISDEDADAMLRAIDESFGKVDDNIGEPL